MTRTKLSLLPRVAVVLAVAVLAPSIHATVAHAQQGEGAPAQLRPPVPPETTPAPTPPADKPAPAPVERKPAPAAEPAKPVATPTPVPTPAAGEPAGEARPVMTPVPAEPAPPPPPAASADLKAQCMSAINSDPAWTDELIGKLAELDATQWTPPRIEQIKKKISAGFFADLDAISLKRHEDDARLIATNRRHVVLAYAAIWLLTIGFVVFIWRRNQALRVEMTRLERDLQKAVKDAERGSAGP